MSELLGTVEFAWPWMAAAIVLPLLVRKLLPAAPARDEAALKVPDAGLLLVAEAEHQASALPAWRRIFAVLAWLLLVIAAMRPQVLGEETAAPVTGRNLMLAVDLSGSMEVQDFQLGARDVNRLQATKAVAGEFLDRRSGDRLGLILFGDRAYLQAPLTFDRETVKTLLLESAIGLAGEKTAIGDAIGLAVKRIRDRESDASQQVLILLTDGANTAGNIPPLKAAELAAAAGLRIYTIGIGADRKTVAGARPGRVLQINPSTDLDEATLQRIADLTGGAYFRARDTRALQDIYETLDRLEPAATEEEGLRPVYEYFFWPLGAALLAFAISAMPALRRVIHRPGSGSAADAAA